MELRTLIFETALQNPEIGHLTETLKWGEPSYVPAKPKTGTAVRVAWKSRSPDTISLYVNCQTSLIERWRTEFPKLHYVGNREITLPLSEEIPSEISACIGQALRYHIQGK